MSGYDSIKLGPARKKEFKALPAGKYGTSKQSALKLVNYNGAFTSEKAPDLVRHSYLVASVNGTEGTAFRQIQINPAWLSREWIVAAFGYEDAQANQSAVTTIQRAVALRAANRARENNTPAEQMEEATQTAYNNFMQQVQIAIGDIWHLLDWLSRDREEILSNFDFASLVGAEFSGTVVDGYKPGTSEVKSIYGKSKAKQATPVAVA